MIDHPRGENEPIRYHFSQFVASIGKHCQSGAVGYGNGEGEEEGIAVVTPSLMAGIITDSSTEEFTVPKVK